MDTSAERCDVTAVDVSCADEMLRVVLGDGRIISVPLAWFPRLLEATPKQRADWEFLGGGMGIHWEAIDEDISIASLLHPENFMLLYNDLPHPTPKGRRRRVVRRRARV